VQKDSKFKIADMYAKAWFGAAVDNKCVDDVFAEVMALKASFEQNRDMWVKLSCPVDDTNLVLPLIKNISKKMKFSNVTAETLQLIGENKRIDLLELIADYFKNLYYKHKGVIEVNVDTVIDLTPSQRDTLQNIMEEKLHQKVTLNFRINPEILGGLALSFNSFLIDDTLSTKIKGLEQLIMGQN
jgi:F-type H+-transporting ATPase subunit delta